MKSRKSKILRGRASASNNEAEEGNDAVTKSPFPFRGNGCVSSVRSRKELRMEQRKAKKSQKHQYLLAKCGREDLVQKAAEALFGKGKKKKKKKRKNKKKNKSPPEAGEGNEGTEKMGKGRKSMEESEDEEEEEEDEDAKFVREAVRNKLEGREREDLAVELKKDNAKLRKEMDEVRRKRLLEENEEEERIINQLSKKLKLKKKAIIPESFRTDGLDFLLEVCEKTSGSKEKKKGDGNESDDDDIGEMGGDDSDDFGSEMDEDDILDEEEEDASVTDASEEGDEFDDKDGSQIGVEDEDEDGEGISGSEAEAGDSDEDEDNFHDEDAEDDDTVSEDDMDNKKKKKLKLEKKQKKDKKADDGVWEDIYGRLRSKDGAVLNEKLSEPAPLKTVSGSGKYVPPALRGSQSKRDQIVKQLKGLLNRLSESNMHSIAKQVEEMYMSNSRNEMNQTLFELLSAVLVRRTLTPERVVLEHIMLIAVLHANVGTEVGAFFIQSFTQEFKLQYDHFDDAGDEEDKHLENLLLIISYIYHFKIVDACLIYDILKLLGDSFKQKDVELILTVLRSIGFRLRKDDPAQLKELILTLQQKVSKQTSGASGGAKIKFMLEVLMAIRNNNMNKIPNYDPSFGDHLLKIVKSHLHPGNYVSEMKIGLKDLLNADQAGRWWIVGSAWTGKQTEDSTGSENTSTSVMSSEDAKKHAKLMKRARAQGMNTDARRNIFCILMTAEDYMDAFEKLNHLGLRNNQDREIIHVAVYCCLQEKMFNPYYAFILSKFSTMDRKLMLALQFNLWDRLKDLNSLTSQQRNNLAQLLVHLINDKSLPLSTLKVVEYAEMDKVKLKFLKKILTGVLMQKDVENLQEIFIKPSLSEKLGLFRESLKLFLNHFMLQESITTSDGSVVESDLSEKQMSALKGRIKIAEKCMTLGKGGFGRSFVD